MQNAKKLIPAISEADKIIFLSKISTTPTESGCLDWIAGKSERGYGQFKIGKSTFRSHRMAYFLHHGTDPGEMLVCHRCDRPACCNPSHLFLDDNAGNTADRDRKGRQARGETIKSAKLTAADIPLIRNDPRSQRKIAAAYGVDQALIGQIKNGKIWRHVA